MQEDEMVVGRTLWDLLWEVINNPRLTASLLAALILLEIALMILAFLIHRGYLTLRLSYGGLEVEIHPLVLLLGRL